MSKSEVVKIKELRKLPQRDWNKQTDYDSLYVINSGTKHDSGFAWIDIIGINDEEKEIAACCDDIIWDVSLVNSEYNFRSDMLYPSGVLRFWSKGFKFRVGASLSSTTIKLIPCKRDGN